MFAQKKYRMAITAGLLVSSLLSAAVTVPAIFGSHMVLQQKEPIVVWGWADAGEAVTVTISGNSQQATADAQGAWRVELPALEATTDLTMTIAGTNTLSFDDVAVGEVWLCSGQSNMEMGIAKCLDPEKEIAAANYPDIRLIDVPKTTKPIPQRNFTGKWLRCSPESVVKQGTWGGFSAAAYYFGRKLHKELGVPVGLIDSSWGGSRIEPWTPQCGFDAVPATADIASRVRAANPSSQLHKKLLNEHLQKMTDWIAASKAAMQKELPVTTPPDLPGELKPLSGYGDPAAMYNAMIHPLVPFAIRGAIWYQGESNHGDYMRYVDKTKAQVLGWRQIWSRPNLPYYYVQIAPYQYGSEDPTRLATFWEAQAAIETQVPHTGMAVVHDVGNLKDIHPKNKQVVGERLALLALNETYGKKDIVCRGPLFSACSFAAGEATIRFRNAAGLSTRDGKAPDWFEIGGDNGRFCKATAKIVGETVVLSSPEVTKASAARFMWHKLAEPNLMNGAELPASAFQFGKIPEEAVFQALIPEAKEFQLLYSADLKQIKVRNNLIAYDIDNRKTCDGEFDRIAYFLELRDGRGKQEYVFAAMNPFSTDLGKIGIPAFATKASFQKKIDNLFVRSNVPGLKTGNIGEGTMEFWACNYGTENAAKVPGASESKYDFGDQMRMDVPNGYGCMQIHNPAAKQVVFAYNNWKAGLSADVGIGNARDGHPDRTFAKNLGSYASAKLQVFVRPKK